MEQGLAVGEVEGGEVEPGCRWVKGAPCCR